MRYSLFKTYEAGMYQFLQSFDSNGLLQSITQRLHAHLPELYSPRLVQSSLFVEVCFSFEK